MVFMQPLIVSNLEQILYVYPLHYRTNIKDDFLFIEQDGFLALDFINNKSNLEEPSELSEFDHKESFILTKKHFPYFMGMSIARKDIVNVSIDYHSEKTQHCLKIVKPQSETYFNLLYIGNKFIDLKNLPTNI